MELDYILGRSCYILVPLGSTGKQYVVAECIVWGRNIVGNKKENESSFFLSSTNLMD